MKPETIFERTAEMLVAEMDGDLVMMDVAQGSYFSINPVGAHIWNQLETPHRFDALADTVQKAFKADDTTQIAKDVERFLTDLMTNKLIREVVA